MKTSERAYVRRGIPGPSRSAEYQREYRNVNPDYTRRNNVWNKARHLALEALRERHLAEFERIFAKKLEEAGW